MNIAASNWNLNCFSAFNFSLTSLILVVFNMQPPPISSATLIYDWKKGEWNSTAKVNPIHAHFLNCVGMFCLNAIGLYPLKECISQRAFVALTFVGHWHSINYMGNIEVTFIKSWKHPLVNFPLSRLNVFCLTVRRSNSHDENPIQRVSPPLEFVKPWSAYYANSMIISNWGYKPNSNR